jgi:hypothetical protein
MYRVGMLSIEMEYFCTELECNLQGWNAFDGIGIPLCRVGVLSTGMECFRQRWNTFGQSGNALYRVGMISIGLECFL